MESAGENLLCEEISSIEVRLVNKGHHLLGLTEQDL